MAENKAAGIYRPLLLLLPSTPRLIPKLYIFLSTNCVYTRYFHPPFVCLPFLELCVCREKAQGEDCDFWVLREEGKSFRYVSISARISGYVEVRNVTVYVCNCAHFGDAGSVLAHARASQCLVDVIFHQTL